MKRYQDIISSVVLLLFAGVYALATSSVEIKNFNTIGGARLVPYICSAVLALCALFILFQGLRGLKAGSKAAGAEQDAKEQPEKEVPSNYKNLLLTLSLIILYALLFGTLGFIPSTILFTTAQIFVLMPQKTPAFFLRALFAGVITSFAVYFLFTKLFYVMLPSGILG